MKDRTEWGWNFALAVVLAGVTLALLPSGARAQEETPQPEGPSVCGDRAAMAGDGVALDSAAVAIADHNVDVCYAARAARGRPVFGHSLTFQDTQWVVQYDELWNTGVVFSTPTALEVAGVLVEAGEYAIYAIPSSFQWTIILNSNTDRFVLGEPYRALARASEIGRGLVASSATSGYVEQLTLRGEAGGSGYSDLILEWERTQVRIPMRSAATRGTLTCELRGTPDRLAARASPADSLDLRVGEYMGKVCYGRPSARNRRIFGGLVPYDDMWRVGANEPTVLHLPFNAEIAGIPVEPGTYALMAIPSPNQWTIVVTRSTNQWGRVTPTERFPSYYSPSVRAREVGRALVPSGETSEFVERLLMRTEEAGEQTTVLILEWERTQLRIPIRAMN